MFQTVLVHNPETICLTYFIDLLLQRGKPIMLVGNAGVGKTILVTDKVSKLKEDYMVAKVPFNYYTTSAMLQRKNLFPFFNKIQHCLFYQQYKFIFQSFCLLLIAMKRKFHSLVPHDYKILNNSFLNDLNDLDLRCSGETPREEGWS